VLRPQPLPLDERRARAAAASLSNGKLCTGTGLPEPLSHRLAQEAALVARGAFESVAQPQRGEYRVGEGHQQ
ncbi:hypothetical protein M9458_030387, partial [Cirrhinus mrigala]